MRLISSLLNIKVQQGQLDVFHRKGSCSCLDPFYSDLILTLRAWYESDSPSLLHLFCSPDFEVSGSDSVRLCPQGSWSCGRTNCVENWAGGEKKKTPFPHAWLHPCSWKNHASNTSLFFKLAAGLLNASCSWNV